LAGTIDIICSCVTLTAAISIGHPVGACGTNPTNIESVRWTHAYIIGRDERNWALDTALTISRQNVSIGANTFGAVIGNG
jgi:hypothetical protein